MAESSIPSSLFTYSVIHTRTDSWLLTLYFGLQSDISLGGLFLSLGVWRGCCRCLLKSTGLALGNFSSCLLCPFGVLSSLWDCFLFDTSLLSGIHGAPGSFCIFPAPGLESAISPGALVPFGMALETKIWALGVLAPVGVSLLLDTLS